MLNYFHILLCTYFCYDRIWTKYLNTNYLNSSQTNVKSLKLFKVLIKTMSILLNLIII